MATARYRIEGETNTNLNDNAFGSRSGSLFFTHEGGGLIWVSKDTPMTYDKQGHTVCPGDSWEYDSGDDVYLWAERATVIAISEIN